MEKMNIKVGDEINLENISLYASDLDPEPMGNTEKLNCDKFKVNSVAVTSDSQTIGIIKDNNINIDEIKEKYEEEYGTNLRILFNVDKIDSSGNIISPAGWVDYDDYINLVNADKDIKMK